MSGWYDIVGYSVTIDMTMQYTFYLKVGRIQMPRGHNAPCTVEQKKVEFINGGIYSPGWSQTVNDVNNGKKLLFAEKITVKIGDSVCAKILIEKLDYCLKNGKYPRYKKSGKFFSFSTTINNIEAVERKLKKPLP